MCYYKNRPRLPITLTVRKIPSEVLLANADGMPRDCAVNLDHPQTASKGKIVSLTTTLSAKKMQQVRSSAMLALEF